MERNFEKIFFAALDGFKKHAILYVSFERNDEFIKAVFISPVNQNNRSIDSIFKNCFGRLAQFG